MPRRRRDAPDDDDDPPDVHDVAEVARRLHLHPKTVYRHARSGVLPMKRIGRHWYMTHADLDRLIDGG